MISNSHSIKTLRIGITIGDISGIGPEIVYQSLCRPWPLDVQFFLYAPRKIFDEAKQLFPDLKIDESTRLRVIESEVSLPEDGTFKGVVNKRSGFIAVQCLEEATNDLARDRIDALVTAPIHKTACRLAGFQYEGHTDFLADFFNCDSYFMSFISPRLKTLLVTDHLSLSRSLEVLNSSLLEKAIIKGWQFLNKLGIESPEIWVSGLNPHAGENGQLGTEEQDWIIPLISKLKNENLMVKGPFSPDTIFFDALDKDNVLVIALTHDHGLAPFKMVSFYDGVNYSLGLPKVRTSPDHGTAFNIAWKGQASCLAMVQAIKVSIQIAKSQ